MDPTCTEANPVLWTASIEHNVPGTPWLEADVGRVAAEQACMAQAPYRLDEIRRDAALRAIQQVCAHRGWCLLAVHVRTIHVHPVIEAEVA